MSVLCIVAVLKSNFFVRFMGDLKIPKRHFVINRPLSIEKCFAVNILKFEILQTTWKNKTISINMLHVLIKMKTKSFCSLFHFFYAVCKISNFKMWTAEDLTQASCIELTLYDIPWRNPIFLYLSEYCLIFWQMTK